MIPLAAAGDEARFGGKAANLARAIAARLPVPPGFALAWDLVDALAADAARAAATLAPALAALARPVAVRSSAVGEDSAGASFAGQHTTRLNVPDAATAAAALHAVWASGRAASALAYRRKLGLSAEPRMGVVVQALIPADVAGVLFTRDPITGADERVIEAAFGLGEAVVAGLVTPDHYRVGRDGAVLLARAGSKEIAVRPGASGGTHEAPVENPEAPALSSAQLAALAALASRCEAVFPPPLDLEWAFAGGALHLLQCRRMTR